MSGGSLTRFAERCWREVDQEGTCVERVRIISADGTVWCTWFRDQVKDADSWLEEAEAMLTELGEGWASGAEVLVQFVAESAKGEVLQTLQKPIAGRGRKGTGGAGSFNGQHSALASSMDAQAKTMDRILGSANVQIEVLTKTVATQGQQVSDLLNYIVATREKEALEKEASTDLTKELLGTVSKELPAVLEVLRQATARGKSNHAAKAAAAAVAASPAPVNGSGSAAS